MKKEFLYLLFAVAVGELFIPAGTATAADRVVVIPLGGAVGDATAADVVKGKTFSSKAVGKGKTGTLKLRDGATIYTNSIGMEFSLIPAGSFVMGSPDGSNDTVHPPVQTAEPGRKDYENQHYVTLTHSFYIQTTEATQGQWLAVMGTNPSANSTCGDNCPVENMTWDEVHNFIDALNNNEGRANCNTIPNTCYALPTEAQWEYAARAGTTSAFYNGDITQLSGKDPNLDEIAWYNDSIDPIPIQPVAQKLANNWGLYDMSGNVSEWCQDRGASTLAPYPDGPETDPSGASSGSYHVIRGGNFNFTPGSNRSATRYSRSSSSRSFSQGFRLVLHSGQ
ncbi:MAG TPA: formylglycine-generating enzyme family protein [Desulfobulbus sp.]|nr:formylglycine-generating enzyme family protein [Desulfobulbus sp.]